MPPSQTPFTARLKSHARRLLIRLALLLAGAVLLLGSIAINYNAGDEVVAGLVSPDSMVDLVVSIARLIAPIPGLWMIYRALR